MALYGYVYLLYDLLTRAQLSLGEADRTSRYLLLVYCLSPYARHYI